MRSENLNIRAAAGRAGASEKLDIRAAAGITGAYVAYMMGSGFSTGQEILQYFACYGMAGLFSILLCMGLLIFAAVSFTRAGYREKFQNPADVYVYYCGKRLGKAYHYFTTVSIYLCFIVMVAAAGAAGGVIAFYIGMLLIYFAIMLNIDELAGAQIPMLILAGRISPVTSGVFSILIVTGIYTASVPLLWQTAFRLAEEGSLRFRRISVLLAALGIAASLLLPFNRLMNIVYVLIGYLGFLLLACMVLKAAKIIK